MQSSSTQQSLPLHSEDYKEIILDEANRLYDKLLKHFIDSIMDNTAASSSPHNGSWAT
jgi:hypothetical protein